MALDQKSTFFARPENDEEREREREREREKERKREREKERERERKKKDIEAEIAGRTNRIVVSYVNLHNGWNCFSRKKNGRRVKLKKRKTVKGIESMSP